MKDLQNLTKKFTNLNKCNNKKFRSLQTKYPKNGNKLYSKSEVLECYRELLRTKKINKNRALEKFLITKPTRTISGVAPVTVLTKPYKCPGNCVFCPTMTDQPKSYLSSEPGAARAKMMEFNPYDQVKIRIKALDNIGHNTEKVELLILGGTWSYYPKDYQLIFIINCLRAMNGKERVVSKRSSVEDLKSILIEEQIENETASKRCVGMVIETRPDFIDEKEVRWLRFLGVTKVQLGVQSLDNRILEINERGHTVMQSKKAIKLLRLGGFKIHIHWMPNLLGSDPDNDYKDFIKIFNEKSIRPDELKIYPCLLLKNSRLYEYYQKRKFKPYSKKELIDLLSKCKAKVPIYCRINRLYRDIPSFEIAEGVKETNFREILKDNMEKKGLICNCIRCREIRGKNVASKSSVFNIFKYETNVSHEYFISNDTESNELIGFLRLSLPKKKFSENHFIEELKNSAIIREVHVYGISKKIKSSFESGAQHKGVGTKLIQIAEREARKKGFWKISVISAIGTREYYRKLGYKIRELYMHKKI